MSRSETSQGAESYHNRVEDDLLLIEARRHLQNRSTDIFGDYLRVAEEVYLKSAKSRDVV